MCNPNWLPEKLNNVATGNAQTILPRLFNFFKTDFIDDPAFLNDYKIDWDRTLEENYERGFWHIISKEQINRLGEKERLLDPPRAEKLPWARPLIDNHGDSFFVKCWDYEENPREIRTYIWLENHDYVFIVRKCKTPSSPKAFIVTAFHIDGNSTRRRLMQKWHNRLQGS